MCIITESPFATAHANVLVCILPYCSIAYQTLSLPRKLLLKLIHYCRALSMVQHFYCMLIKCFVNDLIGCEIMLDCMAAIPMHCPFKE